MDVYLRWDSVKPLLQTLDSKRGTMNNLPIICLLCRFGSQLWAPSCVTGGELVGIGYSLIRHELFMYENLENHSSVTDVT